MKNPMHVEIEEGIAWITMDDGKVNALSEEMIGAIDDTLNEAEKAGAVVVLRGREGIFSAGFDLKTFDRGMDASIAMVASGARLIGRLLAFPYPVLTVCTGHAYPMGAFLMLSADVRIGMEGPWQIGMNEVAIGMTVPKFAVELARHRLTPGGFARITSAPMFAPEDAMRIGYLDRVVPHDGLEECVRDEVSRLRALDMPSYLATKARINGRVIAEIQRAIEDEMVTTVTH